MIDAKAALRTSSLAALIAFVAAGIVLAPLAEAAPRQARAPSAKSVKPAKSGGVTVSTQDLDGDGTPDTVVAPKPRPKPRKRGPTVSTQDVNGDGIPDTIARTRARPRP